jgi:putative hydroxymethylpyrimidine transport system substrate-binding protein
VDGFGDHGIGGTVLRRSARIGVAALATAALIVVGGCGEKEDGRGKPGLEPFSVALDFYVNPDHAGIFTGLERGDFAEAGLDVETEVPADPSAPIRQVAAGRADLAISYEPEVLLALDQGLPVRTVGALVDQPLTSLISLPAAGIETPADLAGKTIATAGIPYQTAFLEAILDTEGLSPQDVEQVDVGLGLLPAVLSRRADAMLGGFLNVEGVDLELRGKNPRVEPVDELGIPTYDELVLVANTDRIEEDPEPIRLFIAALERGTQAAADDPEAATQAVLEAGEGLEPKLTEAEIAKTLPLLQPSEGERFGFMDPREWKRFIAFMANEGLIATRPGTEEALTNELLP